MYYFEAPPGNKQFRDMFWTEAIRVSGHVLKHSDLYEGELRSGSDVALLVLYNERGRAISASTAARSRSGIRSSTSSAPPRSRSPSA